MPIDVNGYSAQFNQFVQFAEQAGKSTAKAQVGGAAEGGALAGRTIVAKTRSDSIGNVGRLADSREINDVARDLFKRTVVDMFGGEDKIPAGVRDAMKLQDYGKGRPLTARRILAVKNAIDASGVLRQKAFDESISKFQDQAGMEKVALAKGYSKAELPRLAAAANLYARATGCSEADALEQVSTPGSKGNRLMNYGGRFLQSADNFKNGLRLLDSFSAWFDETGATLAGMKDGQDMVYEDGLSNKTLLNAFPSNFAEKYKGGMEKFAFEELAVNPSIDLSATDGNEVFGLENNPATSCIARNFHASRTQTFSQIPPEKRSVLFKALNVLCPLYASTAEEARVPPATRPVIKSRDMGLMTARVLKNFDQVAKLAGEGKLDAASLVKTCFPEIPRPGPDPAGDVVRLLNQWDADMSDDPETGDPPKFDANRSIMQDAMEATGCSIEDAFQIAKGEKQLPTLQYYSSGTLSLAAFDGSLTEARDQLAGDLHRPFIYKSADAPLNDPGMLELGPDYGFRFNFPDGQSLVTNKTEQGKANIPTAIGRLEALCGKTHPRQISSLLMMTCQAGLSSLRGALSPHGITSNEHSPVDFNFTKNEETGDITIRYTSPKGLPFSFEWTATVSPDGYVSSTPFRFNDEATLKKEMSATADAIKDTRNFKSQPAEVKDRVASLLVETAKSDRDLLALMRMNRGFVTYGIVLNAAGQVRSDDKILQKLEALRDNVNELRAATRGDGRLFEMGLKQLAMLEGNALKPGVISRMFETVANEDVGELRNLSGKSSPQDIFKATCRLHGIVSKACIDSKVGASFDEAGGVETIALNSFVTGLVFARLDEKTLTGIRDALYSKNGGTVQIAMDRLYEGRFPQGSNVDPQLRISISTLAHTLGNTYRYDLAAVVNDALGIEAPPMPDGEEGLTGIDEKHFKQIASLMEDYALEFQNATQAAQAQLNP